MNSCSAHNNRISCSPFLTVHHGVGPGSTHAKTSDFMLFVTYFVIDGWWWWNFNYFTAHILQPFPYKLIGHEVKLLERKSQIGSEVTANKPHWDHIHPDGNLLPGTRRTWASSVPFPAPGVLVH